MQRLFLMSLAVGVVAAAPQQAMAESQHSPGWSGDYQQAYASARRERKILLIAFHSPQADAQQRRFEQSVLTHSATQPKLDDYVLCSVPTNARVKVGKEMHHLHSHASFAELRGRPGVVMIDLRNRRSRHYGKVVSIYPYSGRRYISMRELGVMMGLPVGSLTQRTLVFAVRTHPETPRSAWASFHPTLAQEAELHSRRQARLDNQGHHDWDSRFQRINHRIGGGVRAQEVCAESWPNQGLLDAARECVESWRQSSGHWSAVRGRQRFFAFDMKRGLRGVWYATGLFAR